MKTQSDVVIVGGGVAGLTAAIYCARYDLTTTVVSEELGGATTTAWTIDNYPGTPHIDGLDLVLAMEKQSRTLGSHIVSARATALKRENHTFLTDTTAGQIESHALILALGTLRKHLGLPRERELLGKGVHYCVTCDAPLYKAKKIVIVGGGDSSVKGAIMAAAHASEVCLITIESSLHGEPVNMNNLHRLKNVVIMTDTQVTALHGKDKLTGVMVRYGSGKIDEIACDGLFIEIGATPNSKLAHELGVKCDDQECVIINTMCETNIAGVTAAGDVTNLFGTFKQDITAAAQGALSATSAYRYLTLHNDQYFCQPHAISRRKLHTK